MLTFFQDLRPGLPVVQKAKSSSVPLTELWFQEQVQRSREGQEQALVSAGRQACRHGQLYLATEAGEEDEGD